MSRQLLSNNDTGVARGRDGGRMFGGAVAVTTTPSTAQWIFSVAELDSFSVHLVWTGTVTATVTVSESNSFVPCASTTDGGDYQDEAQAIRAGNWADTTTRWKTGFTAPAGSAGTGVIRSGDIPPDTLYIKIALSAMSTGSGTGTVNGYLSGKSIT